MNEAEWLACNDPTPMLTQLKGKESDRKFRLLTCELLRRYTDLMGAEGWTLTPAVPWRAIELGELWADGKVGDEEILAYCGPTADRLTPLLPRALEAFESCVEICRYYCTLQIPSSLLCEAFGNPFRPVTFSPEWRTDTAVLLARTMYDAREFSAMPILADALQDAGCDSDDILAHCRGPGPHVRGCWVVDLVLGKV